MSDFHDGLYHDAKTTASHFKKKIGIGLRIPDVFSVTSAQRWIENELVQN